MGQMFWLQDMDETMARVCGCLGEARAPVEQDCYQVTSSLDGSPGPLLPVSGGPAGPLDRSGKADRTEREIALVSIVFSLGSFSP